MLHVVTGAYAREKAISHRDRGMARTNKASDLGQYYQQSNLFYICRLASSYIYVYIYIEREIGEKNKRDLGVRTEAVSNCLMYDTQFQFFYIYKDLKHNLLFL